MKKKTTSTDSPEGARAGAAAARRRYLTSRLLMSPPPPAAGAATPAPAPSTPQPSEMRKHAPDHRENGGRGPLTDSGRVISTLSPWTRVRAPPLREGRVTSPSGTDCAVMIVPAPGPRRPMRRELQVTSPRSPSSVRGEDPRVASRHPVTAMASLHGPRAAPLLSSGGQAAMGVPYFPNAGVPPAAPPTSHATGTRALSVMGMTLSRSGDAVSAALPLGTVTSAVALRTRIIACRPPR
jgi:hypothetical protein